MATQRRGRLLLHRRPQEGPDHPRRLQRLPARDRGGALRAPGRGRGGRRRDPARHARRGGRRRGRAQAGRHGDPRRAARRSSRSGSPPTSTRGTSGSSTQLPKGPTGKILRREVEPPADVLGELVTAASAADGQAERLRRRRRRRSPARPAADRRGPRDRCAGSARRCPRSGSAGLARRPRTVARRSAALAGELGQDRGRALGRRPAPRGPPLRRPGLDGQPVPPPDPAGLPGGAAPRPNRWSPTPIWTGATASGSGSSSTTSSTRRRPATTRCSTRCAWKALIDTGGRARCAGCARSSPTWPPPRGCRRWSSRTPSRSAATSPSRPGRWCCAPRSSS